jgi:hypothetical protein
LAISPVFLYSQSISVKSFKLLPNDLDTTENAHIKDQNGDDCGIIKVISNQSGFSFYCGSIGIAKTVQKLSEIWVYVPVDIKTLTISHPQLGLLKDFAFPVPIENGSDYELVLTTMDKDDASTDETIQKQWLLINPEPADALVYLNDKFMGKGVYQAKLNPGRYTYRIESPLYVSTSGKVDIVDAKIEKNIILKSAFGYLFVSTEPMQDAKIIIDGKLFAKTTPCKSDSLAPGKHTLQIVKDMYKSDSHEIIIFEGQILNLTATLTPNFAEVKITAPDSVKIYINKEEKGSGTWGGLLNDGIYSIEAKDNRYISDIQEIKVSAGEKQTVHLRPTPIYGSLDLMAVPAAVSIFIDGEKYGTTPNTINNLLIGEHTLTLKKPGYASLTKKINIKEKTTTEVNESLATIFGRLDLIATPAASSIIIDGEKYGTTPNTINKLLIGLHTITFEKPGYASVTKAINIKGNFTNVLNETLLPLFGSLDVFTTPTAASIIIDGKKYGTTPKTINNLLIGQHTLTLEKHGYATLTKTIRIKGNIRTVLDNTITPIFSSLKVISIPGSASIIIDGKKYGKTPKKINKLLVGEHTLTLKKHGYLTATKTISIKGGITNVLNENLLSMGDFFTITFEPKEIMSSVDGISANLTPSKDTLDLRGHSNNPADQKNLTTNGYQGIEKSLNVNFTEGVDVTISSKPTGALITLNGSKRGLTPQTIKLNAGAYPLKLDKEEYTLETDLLIGNDGKTEFTYTYMDFEKSFYKKHFFSGTLGYHATSFYFIRNNWANSNISNALGYAVTANLNLFPVFFDLTYFSSGFTFTHNSGSQYYPQTEKCTYQHKGVEMSVNAVPAALGKYVYPYIGIGYQFSKIYSSPDWFEEFRSGESYALIGKGGIKIRIKRLILFGEYKRAFDIKEAGYDSGQICSGIGVIF